MPKASPNPLARRKTSSGSPFKKPSTPIKDDGAPRLQDTGHTPSLAGGEIPQDVIDLIRYIQAHTWQDVPDRAAGMGSERISEVLRFRTSLPAIVSIAHLHALSTSSTKTERELAKCISQGIVRRLTIPGRGKGGAVGEGVVLISDWKERLMEEQGLREELKMNYSILLDRDPACPTIETKTVTNEGVRDLVAAGFLTSPSSLSSAGSAPANNLFAAPGTSSLLNISSAGYSAPTGSNEAVGGYGAVHESGGSGSMLATIDTRPSKNRPAQQMTLSIPGTGAYLKLLTEARLHLLHLLKQLSPQFKEATMEVLKERWEGNTLNDATSHAKRARGEWKGVLPGQTKKWRQFYGLEYEAILAECVGSGLVELFDTGMGAVGVRAR